MKFPNAFPKPMGVNQLVTEVQDLGKGEEVELVDVMGRPVKTKKGVWMEKFQRHVGVQSKGYKLIQHQDAFMPIVDSFALGTPEVVAAVAEQWGRAYMYCALPDTLTFKAPDGGEIVLGIAAVNSYDGSTALTIAGFGYRVSCMNALVLEKALGVQRIVHFGKAKEMAESFLQDLNNRMAKLFEYIAQARERERDDEIMRAFLKQRYGKKVGMDIHDIAYNKYSDETNDWGLYNAVTDYFTHDTPLNARLQHSRLRQAEAILVNPEHVAKYAKRWTDKHGEE